MISCGHCKNKHQSVDGVRACAEDTLRWTNYLADAQAKAEYDEECARQDYLAELRTEQFFESGSEAFQAQYQAEIQADEARAWNDPYVNGELAFP